MKLTMLDLVRAVSRYARTESEVVAAVVSMVNARLVRLGGSFAGSRFEARDGSSSRADTREGSLR
jgi:hypothetical protein